MSGAAITRFSQRVGCEGYPHIQRLVRAELRATLGLKRPGPQDAAVARFWAGERANLDGLAALPEGELLAFAGVLARARQVRELAEIVGGAALSATDQLYLEFATTVEHRLLDQQRHELRAMDETLRRCWDVAAVLPRRELTMLSQRFLEAHQGKGG